MTGLAPTFAWVSSSRVESESSALPARIRPSHSSAETSPGHRPPSSSSGWTSTRTPSRRRPAGGRPGAEAALPPA